MVAQQRPLIVFDDGRELVEVTDEQQLQAAKGLQGVAVAAQHLVNGVEQVCPHHADFVDDEQVEGL